MEKPPVLPSATVPFDPRIDQLLFTVTQAIDKSRESRLDSIGLFNPAPRFVRRGPDRRFRKYDDATAARTSCRSKLIDLNGNVSAFHVIATDEICSVLICSFQSHGTKMPEPILPDNCKPHTPLWGTCSLHLPTRVTRLRYLRQLLLCAYRLSNGGQGGLGPWQGPGATPLGLLFMQLLDLP